MTKETAGSEVIHEFVLKESIDISTINSFYDDLKTLLTDKSQIVIDAADVKRLDTSALQLLCCWHREAMLKGIDVRWKNIDGALFNAAKLLGVTEQLALE